MLNKLNTSEYLEFPIFLHSINRELHDAVEKIPNRREILFSIRAFSILSCQIMFCNVSQIHEMFYQDVELLNEITKLSLIQRFMAHSDYGSFEEFRASRAEQFAPTLSRHPGFYSDPIRELRNLPLSYMGKGASTTQYIESELTDFLENSNDTSLKRTLSQDDAKSLRACEEWIRKTLTSRDQKALTFDAFERTANDKITKNAEGAIRRVLTEIYINNYLEAFDARCIWGFNGINHFERKKLLAGLNIYLANTVLTETGIHSHLSALHLYGLEKRIITENTPALAFFRQSYATMSANFDQMFGGTSAWHICNRKIISYVQYLRSSGVLRPKYPLSSYEDLLNSAGEALLSVANFNDSGVEYNLVQNYGYAYSRDNKNIFNDVPAASSTMLECENKHVDAKCSDYNYNLLVIVGAFVVGIITYLILTAFFDISITKKIIFSLISSVIGGVLFYWFHPVNFYRRISVLSLGLAGFGAMDYRLKLQGRVGESHSLFEIGTSSSEFFIGGMVLFAIISLVIDAWSRKNSYIPHKSSGQKLPIL